MLAYIQTPYGKFVGKDGDLITRQLKQYGAHTRNELAMLKSYLKPSDIVIDIGAHIGTVSIPIAKMFGKDINIYAFEPNPESYFLLKHNVYLNHLTEVIKCFPNAMGAKDEEALVKFESFPFNTGSNCLYESDDGTAIQFTTVDSFLKKLGIEKLDLIKIDVEGRELEVLNGALDSIQKFRPMIYLEVCDNQLARFNASLDKILVLLKSFDYEVFRNIGPRNSSNDNFEIREFVKTDEELFDLLFIASKD